MTKLPIPPIKSGGLLPAVQLKHERSTVDGSTVGVRVVWFRLGLNVEFDLPFGSYNPEFGPKWRPW